MLELFPFAKFNSLHILIIEKIIRTYRCVILASLLAQQQVLNSCCENLFLANYFSKVTYIFVSFGDRCNYFDHNLHQVLAVLLFIYKKRIN